MGEIALSNELQVQRKYPVDWLLNIGQRIDGPPQHPKNDIPDSVLYENTIKVAEKYYRQSLNSNRFGTMNHHQPREKQPPLANNLAPKVITNTSVGRSVNTNGNVVKNGSVNDDRTNWRKTNVAKEIANESENKNEQMQLQSKAENDSSEKEKGKSHTATK